MTILDWFDMDNIEHLKAYKHLQDTGTWPKGFIPEDNEFVLLQTITLANRLADRYVEEKLSEPHYEDYYEEYSYYVGGEITCGRMPLKYGLWIAAGRPA